jgi:tetratricopeptide (TPR) repeat protein
METLMSVGCRAWKGSMVTGCLVLALEVGLAQNAPRKPAVSSPEATRGILVDKAHALESRGRPDMAIQLWQQILLSDPKNSNALAGMARDLKLIGSDKAGEALESLRKLNPNDPNIPKIEALASTRVESDQLRQAGELARQGKLDDAMRIYKQLYGDHPPDGDIALAYYQTMYGTASGKEAAVSAMRALVKRNPGDPRFAVELGIMLTYESRSRAEGIRILQEHPRDSNAQTALRQALLWDSAHPASAAELRAYLKEHPQDTELAGHLKENAGADELRHRPHASRASRLCGAQRALPGRGGEPLQADSRHGSEERPRRRRHGIPAHAAEEIRRRNRLFDPGRIRGIQGRKGG